jgi:hypothetical protein
MGGIRNASKYLIEKLEGETTWRPRHRWEDNIKVDLKEIGFEGVHCIHVVTDRSSGMFL